ncbi:MAG: hypothetical protein GWO07_11300 [Candidatus Dadabacteria bacterium]|nr:hypothetical protein [Candidatus Dadabacteria bacterium]NIS09325.1 hypothetical protein [Candidatus Dadabacteria bacterium]NIV42498.1 hypothetical protein [Candidatus Dadabacteria bacterium]NIX15866.1 hypothetical protein [Candidatus Dadabacteria bacterium]NIY22575.1 hypothetical protein [Candidatus Dadabacteria bacterium]
MGLIDTVRDQRDCWTKRFEEQRQQNGDPEFDKLSEQEQERIIQENREKVGKFDFNEKR